jgi:hypothetical protein
MLDLYGDKRHVGATNNIESICSTNAAETARNKVKQLETKKAPKGFSIRLS